jgi:two-component system CheB/CheR fusion protein
MPQSALAVADLVLPPKGIALELARISRHAFASPVPPVSAGVADDGTDVAAVLRVLRTATGVDFAQYKPSTVRRRIARRMLLQRIDDLGTYARHLRQTPAEAQALHDEILIQVTGFFREPDGFEALKQIVFPSLVEERAATDPIRIWVPGCATGEEVYSLAISLVEFLGEMDSRVAFQIFATDVSGSAINRARAGTYPAGISSEVTADRLRRFFVPVNGSYQVSKAIRNLCVFAPHDLTRDPPFSKLDLISCCNVLIYLKIALQERIIPVFHYALKPTGFLKLGLSESVGRFTNLFAVLDKRHKVYARKPGPSGHMGFGLTAGDRVLASARAPEPSWSASALEREADRLVLGQYGPVGVLVDADMRIVQFRGKTGPYLEAPSGAASLDLLRMAREGLAGTLRRAIRQAAARGGPVSMDHVRVKTNRGIRDVSLQVIPIGPADGETRRHYLVLFSATRASAPAAPTRGKRAPRSATHDRRAAQLSADLAESRRYVQALTEEHQASVEELRAATEEAQSSNEELQSTNEELETAKEELQATNEELTTVNDELNSRILELAQLNNDLGNLLTSTHVPIIMVGADMRIRRMTPVTERVLNVAPGDVGRPIGDLRLSVDMPDLEAILREVIDTLSIQEREVIARDGRWYSVRIRPYRTVDNRIDGAVISFVDIDAVKRGLEGEQALRAEAEAATRAKDQFLAVLSHELRTPLNAMLGWVRILRSQKLDAAASTHALEVIERNTVLQARLIEDLLDMSRIVAGTLRLDARLLMPAPVVEEAIGALRPQADAKGVRLASQLDSAAGPIRSDPARLQQIISNLVSNAVKFTPRGGDVEVRLVGGESAVEVSVRDTGEGIAAERLPELFARFGAAHTTTQAHGGMGLGLAIVRYLVELHGGTVSAESAGPGRGATFTVRLPIVAGVAPGEAEAASAATGAPASGERPSLQGVRTLIVDDEADARELMRAILVQCGGEVTVAATVQEALAALGQQAFDVLISDIAMPEEDGYDLIRQVRALDARRGGRIPALALTAYARREDRDKVIAAGYDRHATKPIEPADLAAAVAALASRPGRTREA